MDRREFLKTSGALVVSFAAPASEVLGQAAGKPALVPTELDSWIAVLPNGNVQAFFGKMDMGQGLDVAVAQIVAEELDVGFDKVEVVMGDTATSCNQGGASGSTGVSNGARLLRRAAAEARRVLVDRAADQLGTPAGELHVADGVVAAGDRKVSYADLVGGRYFHHKLQWNKQVGNPMDISVPAKPKPPGDYKVVGKPLPRRDVAWKVYGTDEFVTDVRRPGMLHARVIRPPRAACKVRTIDEASIKGLGGARVIRDKDFVAVVAPREWDAVRAAQSLKVEWEPMEAPFPPMEELYDHIRGAKVIKRQDEVKKGDVAAAFTLPGVKVVQAEYEWPFQSHASMGPACAVVEIKNGMCTVWTGSQKPHFVRDGVARLLELPGENVRAIWVAGAGSYGRNDAGDAAMDAAFLARATGKPVRVQGMRADGTAWDPKGPACVHRARAAIDASGKVVGYEFISKGFSRQHIATNESQPADSLIGQSMGVAPKPNQIFGTPAESYGFENKLLGWETIPQFVDHCSPLRTSHFRDPVGPEIHFGSEQFIDEVARAAGEDPVAFRLRYLSEPRHAAVVKAVAEKSSWSSLGKGKGIAFAERNGTAVAVVAQVEVDSTTGRVWARKVWVAHDCG
ncbi:MAG: molybdopterin cofactor-binding domain-containing protein, partial [Burkholderiales bacterium]